jgi:hypothetical protein
MAFSEGVETLGGYLHFVGERVNFWLQFVVDLIQRSDVLDGQRSTICPSLLNTRRVHAPVN